jgi:signal transduction histidine kinase/DNA-binding response OmpR family regulator
MSEQKTVRILYMEDDIGLARLFQKRLNRAGYQVDLAANGAEGLAMYAAGQYDVVAVDHNMPIYDGLEVIRCLAERGPLPPTLMITGAGNEKIAIEAMKLGAGDYIVKDIEGGYLELLPSVIEQLLYQQRLVEERQQAIKAMQHLNRNLALLNLIGQKLAASLDLQEIMELLLRAVTETIGAEGSSVWFKADDEAGGLICQSAYSHNHKLSPANLRLSPGQGIAGWVVEHGGSVIISDAAQDARFSSEIDAAIDFSTTSVLAAPLRVRDTVIGVLEVVNKIGSNFDGDDQSLVETLAASAAIAIDNARLVNTLRQHTEELKIRNEELNAFAHTVAHDLKTPLGPIMGLAELLEKHRHQISEEDVNSSLRGINRNGRKMSNIIDELLLLAKMRDMDVKLQPLDMADIIAEARQRLSYMIEEQAVEIVLPDQWPRAIGYGPWIEEVWVNYMSNAIKYGGQPPLLELGATVQDDGMVRFWVRDNGAGLTPAERAKLFAPFTQLNTIRVDGHGLGLSIVRRIVERLGGQVGVESNGVGSIFTFTLPMVQAT